MNLAAAWRDLRLRAGALPPWVWDVVIAAAVAFAVLASGATRINDWIYYRDGAALLTGGDPLSLYVERPGIQIGPLALLAAAVVDALPGSGVTASVLLISALFMPMMALLRRALLACGRDPYDQLDHSWVRLLLAAGWFSVTAVSQLGDALALLGLLACADLLLRGRGGAAGAALALGVACKPWTLAALPVLLFAPSRVVVRAVAGAAVVGALTWLPFVIAEPTTLDAGQVQYRVPPDAWQRWFGIGELPPDGWRAGQLLAIWAVLLVLLLAVRRGARWQVWVPFVLGLSTLLRLVTELGTWPYYVSVGLPLVLLAERSAAGRRVPWATVLTLVAAWNLVPLLGGTAAAAVRFAALVGAIVVLVMRQRERCRTLPVGSLASGREPPGGA